MVLHIASLLLGLLAMLAKETGFMALGMNLGLLLTWMYPLRSRLKGLSERERSLLQQLGRLFSKDVAMVSNLVAQGENV